MPTPLIIGILLLALLLCATALRAYRRWQKGKREIEAMSTQEVNARVERFVGEPLWPDRQPALRRETEERERRP